MNWLAKLFGRSADRKIAATPAPPSAPASAPRAAADVGRLRRTLAETSEAPVRERIEHELGAALAAAGVAPQPEDSLAVWLEALCQVTDKHLAADWARRIEAEATLAEVAMRSRSSEVRLMAAQRITDGELLQRVADALRDRDKRVFRHCNDLLRTRRNAAERAARIGNLAAALRALPAEGPIPTSQLTDFDRRLAELGADAPDTTECAELVERLRSRIRDEAEVLRAHLAECARAEALAAEIRAAEAPSTAELSAWRHRLAEHDRALSALPSWLAALPSPRGLAQGLAAIRTELTALEADLERTAACESLLAGLTAGTTADEATTAAWSSLAKPLRAGLREALERRWLAFAHRPVPPGAQAAPAQARDRAKPPAPRLDEGALAALVDELERALDEGHLAEATSIMHRIDVAVGSGRLPGALQGRVSRAGAQLARLRGWARWSGEQAREQLIAAAEALLHDEVGVDERAQAVPRLGAEWKRLDAHGPASKSQWERFHAAQDKAWEPVLAQRAERAAHEDEARAAKEALCAEWEAWFAGIAWEHADFKVVEATRHDFLARWRTLGHAGHRAERALRKRLDALATAAAEQITAARAAEVARREALIAAALEAAEDAEIGRAVARAKKLQQRWRDEAGSVRLPRAEEQALWQRFRAGCDAIFARREAQRADTRHAAAEADQAPSEAG